MLLMLMIVLSASSDVSNVRSALPSEQDKFDGQGEFSERETTRKALVPYIPPTTHILHSSASGGASYRTLDRQ